MLYKRTLPSLFLGRLALPVIELALISLTISTI